MPTGIARVLVFAAVLAAPALAQGRAPALPERLGDSARRTIEALGDSLRREGLPWEPLYDKAAEGALKGANDSRIVDVVRSLATRLRQAGAALGPGAGAGDISAAASAIYAGVQPDVLRRVAARRPATGSPVSLALPFTLLADLVSRGIPAREAASSIDTLLVRGAREVDFAELRTALNAGILNGKSPRDAAREGVERTLRALEGRRVPPEPSDR